MTDIDVTSVSEAGYATTTVLDGRALTIDATGEAGPRPHEVLAADYASCFVPAFRSGAAEEGFDDVGTIEIDVWAQLDDNKDLAAITFEVSVEESLGAAVDDIVARAKDICLVHSALREQLRADVTVEDDAAV